MTVAEVKVPAGSIGRFDTMINQLRAQGYGRTDRIYLAFTDATNYCGVGTLWNDDRAIAATGTTPDRATRVSTPDAGPGWSRPTR